MKTTINVYAVFNAEIYEIRFMNGKYTGFQAVDYDDLHDTCNENGYELKRIDGLEDED